MLKKFFATLFLAMIIFVGGQNNSAEAQDVYVGTSPATGWNCYAMTETIQIFNGGVKKATLKMVTNSGKVRYLDYVFEWNAPNNNYLFSNSDGFHGIADRYDTPIEWNMLQVILGKY